MSDNSTHSKLNVHKEACDGDNEINTQISSGNVSNNTKQSSVPPSVDMQNKRRSAAYADNTKDNEIERICPKVNCPERIIICLDVSKEMENPTFRSRSGDKFAPIKLVKRALGIFLQSKHRIDRRHRFALMVIHGSATWMHDLTGDPEDIIQQLDDIPETPWENVCDSFDLGSIFHEIAARVPPPRMEDSKLPPPYIVRAILLYGRSYVIPKFENQQHKQAYRLLQSSNHFFIDAYYIHEPPSEENQCEAAFDAICSLDEKGLSYVFEVSRNPTKLYDCMAQLLAHPLQRPLQKDTNYSIERNTQS